MNVEDTASDHPRQRLAARGVRALADRELVALVLRDGTRDLSALALADAVLKEHGGLFGIASALPEELACTTGIGPAKAAALAAAFQLGRHGLRSPEGVVLRGPADVAAVIRPELSGLRRERVVVIVCDSANRVRQLVTVADGSADRCTLPIRETLNAVLRNDGRAFALAHNHPSGDHTPSDADRHAGQELLGASRVVGLRLLDHVIVAAEGFASALA